MAVDRGQVRRDADLELSGESRRPPIAAAQDLARHCLALLAELEQAEKERERWADRFDRQYDLAQAHESRLAKVPALVEALRRISEWADGAEDGWHPGGLAGGLAEDVLAEWEQG